VVLAILLIPLIAMQFTDEVNWGLGDFLAAGFLLTAAGLGINLTITLVKNKHKRLLIVLCVLLALGLIWAELAVGIFDF